MKTRSLVLFTLVLAVSANAQIVVRNVTEVDINAIPYPNMAGNTTSSQPHKGTVKLKDGSNVAGKITFFKKKGEFSRVKVNTGEEKKEIEADQIASIALDPIVSEKKYPNNFNNPEKNFQPGYVVLPSGVRLEGKIAQLRDFSDYDFFIYNVLFLPQGSSVASTFKGGRLSEFGQEINGVINKWDGYADGYVLRLADGRYRLSRNPYSKTRNEFFTGLKNQATDSLSKQATQSALTRSLKDGQNINESIENAASAGSVVSEVFGQVEINKKEYLIFDTQTNTVTAVNKSNFKEFASDLSAGCANPILKEQLSWDKIEDYIKLLNEQCH